eukprot:CAMPEP_0181289986 /NCGR_PEP_ID=MMETSP1101-20121128/1177_1 /TAXON_ID=46948 /ORGANISM="Rhodomonas abbreviata, Strain Caron Lab Isolate" /LENGTH=301 /DNA_ID=CAMNT_0023394249 /DNA_START=246 /DNA_END=1148 /DNA_ORIENTATION=+
MNLKWHIQGETSPQMTKITSNPAIINPDFSKSPKSQDSASRFFVPYPFGHQGACLNGNSPAAGAHASASNDTGSADGISLTASIHCGGSPGSSEHPQVVAVGITFNPTKLHKSVFEVQDLIVDSPAHKCGQIVVGDRMLEINGVGLGAGSFANLCSMLRGQEGKAVNLLFRRRDATTYLCTLTLTGKQAGQQVAESDEFPRITMLGDETNGHLAEDQQDDGRNEQLLEEVLREGFKDSIWKDVLSSQHDSEQDASRCTTILHSTNTTVFAEGAPVSVPSEGGSTRGSVDTHAATAWFADAS